MSTTDGPRAGAGVYAGLFIVTLSTLMYEIALTRIFSVTMWYHFAFVAISVALFGMTVGALLVHLFPASLPRRRRQRQLWKFSLLFACRSRSASSPSSFPFIPPALAGLWSSPAPASSSRSRSSSAGSSSASRSRAFPSRVNRLYAADLDRRCHRLRLLVVLVGRSTGRAGHRDRRARRLGALCFASTLGQPAGMGSRPWSCTWSAALARQRRTCTPGRARSSGSPGRRARRSRTHVREVERLLARHRRRDGERQSDRPCGVGLEHASCPPRPTREPARDGHRQHRRHELTRYTGNPAKTDSSATRSRTSRTTLSPRGRSRDRRRRRARHPLRARVRAESR